MKGFQDLKKILQDDKLHIFIGKIENLYLSENRSKLKVRVSVWPEERPIIAEMTWDVVGTDSGEFEFPSVNDMVLGVNVEGDDDKAYIIKRLTSNEDTIPVTAIDGDKVSRAKKGRKYWNTSDTRINFSRGDDEPTENLVLGQVFKSFAQELLNICKQYAQDTADHQHIGNLGYLTFKPNNEADFLERKTEYDSIKQTPIDDEAILSDLSFTEK